MNYLHAVLLAMDIINDSRLYLYLQLPKDNIFLIFAQNIILSHKGLHGHHAALNICLLREDSGGREGHFRNHNISQTTPFQKTHQQFTKQHFRNRHFIERIFSEN